MKKKFINGLLLVALFVGFTGSMVSCKDYDDEKVGNLEGLLANKEASLREALEAQKQALEAQINALKEQQQECQATCKAVQEALASKFNEYVTIKQLNQFKDDLGNIYYTKAEVYNKDQVYNKTEIDLLFSDYYTKAQVDAKLKALEDEIKALTDKAAISQTVANLLREGDETLTAALDKYLRSGIVSDIVAADFLKVNNAISDAKAIAEEALKLAKANGQAITGLEETVAKLQSSVATLRTDVDKAQKTASDALAAAEANKKLIENLDAQYKALETKLGNLESDLTAKIEETKKEIAKLEQETNEKFDGVALLIAELDKALGDVKADVKTLGELQENLQADVKKLQEDLDEAYNTLIENQLALQNLIINIMAQYISGVEVNGTYNQLFGYVALPTDMRTNVLVAFSGEIDGNGIEFPTKRPAYYALPDAKQDKLITDEDIEMIGELSEVEGYINDRVGSRTIVAKDGAEGNAGTLYLTINPTDVNFEGTQFELINSQNEPSKVKLGRPQKSDEVLTFGYTRAAGNGFYEIPATLSADDVKTTNKVEVDMSDIKDIINELKGFRDNSVDLTHLATTVYDAMNDMLEANAIKATWEDPLGTKSYVSQYAIAATTMKPLSFSFAKDVKFDHIPGLGRVENFIERMVNNVFDQFPELNNDKFEIESITFDELTGEFDATFTLHLNKRSSVSLKSKTISIQLPDYTIEDEYGNVVNIHPTKPQLTITFDAQECTIQLTWNVSDEIKALNDGIFEENYDKILAQLQDYVEGVNALLKDINSISFENISNSINNQISKFIDWLNTRFARFTNPNRMLQPVLFMKVDNNTRILYNAKNYPAQVDGNGTTLKLFPTTYNAEIVSPAYKKFIAVTDVYKEGVSAKGGNATCKRILNNLNSLPNMKAVIDGGYDSDYIDFPATAGYSYEILYSALDYSGLVVTQKFHVKVVK